MSGIFSSAASSSGSCADLGDQQIITSDDATPEDKIATMMREQLDIAKYDDDVQIFNVIQKKAGKDSWLSLGQHQSLLLQLSDPSKNPYNKLLKVDLLTMSKEDASKKLRKLENEYNTLISDLILYFLKLSIFYSNVQLQMKQANNITIENIEEIQQTIDNYVIMMEGSHGPLKLALPPLNLIISQTKKHLEILQENSLIESCWTDISCKPTNLNRKIEFYQKMIEDIAMDGMVWYTSKENSERNLIKSILTRDTNILIEIAKQQKKTIFKMLKTFTKNDSYLAMNVQEVCEYCNMIPNQYFNIKCLSSETLFKTDDAKINEFVKNINEVANKIDILSNQKETKLNQLGWTVQKENVVLKLSTVDKNSMKSLKDGKILKQVTIKKSIYDMAKILAGHYSDFGNYQLFKNDCRHYASRVLEDLELNN